MSIKNTFVSRFGEQGAMVEMDYSQLEVIGLAILSDDKQLKQDIRDGLDLHCANTAQLYGADYNFVVNQVAMNDTEWVKRRKVVKIFSFQLQYGAGARTMAESAGVTIDEAKKFIEAYYSRYPQVKLWQDSNIEVVESHKVPTNKKTYRGYPASRSILRAATGREYAFYEQDAPNFMRERGTMTSFSPTQIKNYPVQGFSTGDVVPLALGMINRYIIENQIEKSVVLCNTVHDSFIFDVNLENENLDHLRNIKWILEDIPSLVNNLWPAVHFDLPLSVGVEMGPSWGEVKPFDLGEEN